MAYVLYTTAMYVQPGLLRQARQPACADYFDLKERLRFGIQLMFE